MNNKALYFWIATVVITLASVVYQRATGPTYPMKGKVTIGSETVKYKLLRSYGGPDNAEISIDDPSGKLSGKFNFKRYKSNDEWTETDMLHQGGKLVAYIPHQPPAGKVMYQITLTDGSEAQLITKEPVIIRFKGDVPAGILIPHILLMFIAMLMSTRTGIEAIGNGINTYKYAVITLILLIGGGLIFGPIVQKYAFGDYWTGWPMKGIFTFGDLTDNKTAIAVAGWVVAVFMLRRHPSSRIWAIAAAVIMLLVYMIPHSMLGSEIDHTALPK
ncbi:MAG: hypothetical protein H6541_12565 [Lentimicrobiaceae bacterium]|nr:hypothetical protein [Lentimicrobiaceae bacterium]MCB9024079.1 hypothetical protein [Lentimicrobiaceae bacterium]MCO5266695.1 hypothetical protein [Lentimicrobium sp.]